MSLRTELRKEPRQTLFDVLDEVRAGMLGVVGTDQHMQPMTHFPDADGAELWFVTSVNTDLVRAIGQGARAHYCVIGKDQDFHACLSGTIVQSQDRAKLESLWSPAVGAWFQGGIDDPAVCLLRMTLQDAALWASSDSIVAYGVEMLRANLSADHAPDLGDHVVVTFGAAA